MDRNEEMIHNAENTENADAEAYNLVARLMHWIVAACVIGMFALGLWMVDLGYYDPWRKDAPEIHKSIGMILLAVMIFRLFWRMIKGVPEPLSSHSKLEKTGAHLAHIGLYGLLFAIMVTGYLISTADGRTISVFGLLDIPAFGSLFDNQEDIAGIVHFYLAVGVIALASLHALAALKHHFLDKDNTLMRMIRMPKR
ncbi:cytochrome b [Kordiimonas sp. SCSIO 12610]|nr:cytochrome b [Kordiimonas sp. SCSIO 12610]UTW56705.1 cytochrome b [Kordiimonas sp. SCSIO 12610]